MKGIRDFIFICIIVSLFTINSFANSEIINQPLPLYNSPEDNLINGFLAWQSTNNASRLYISSLESNIYAFSTSSTNLSNVYFISESNESFSIFLNRNDWISGNTVLKNNLSYNNDYNLYYSSSSVSATNGNVLLPVFDNYLEGLNAIRLYIENQGSSNTVYGETTISVPRGSVVYIGIPDDGISFSATTTMPIKSGFFSGGWQDSPQRYAYVDDLPISGTTYGKSFGSAIPWVKDGAEGLLGQSFNAKMNYPITLGGSSSTQKYLVIYNPFFYADTLSDNLQDASEIMSSMSVHLSQYTSLKLYKLQQTASAGGITSVSPSNFEQSYEGQITENQDGSSTVTWEGSDENMPSNPEDDSYNTSEGGLRSITDYLNQITQTLTEFANSFINLLQAPISHVRQLISAGSEYFGVIRGLYGWMPTQVQGLLESAMVVSISIGVISLLI